MNTSTEQNRSSTTLELGQSISVTVPELADGEKWLGAIISADGRMRKHIILLPQKAEKINWDDALAWAKSIGGDLPDRCESALLFATMKEQFDPAWYWTNEQDADLTDFAWVQGFNGGGQGYGHKSGQYRARAVRSLIIE